MPKRFRLVLAAAARKRLNAVVGPGFTITLEKANGQRVTTLAPGRYRVVVQDRSDDHTFHLEGPGGVNRSTSVDGMGTVTWNVRLRAGTYAYVCDPHASQMRGSFRVRS
jgi:plastocyanin